MRISQAFYFSDYFIERDEAYEMDIVGYRRTF